MYTHPDAFNFRADLLMASVASSILRIAEAAVTEALLPIPSVHNIKEDQVLSLPRMKVMERENHRWFVWVLMEDVCYNEGKNPYRLMADLYRALMNRDKYEVLKLYKSSLTLHGEYLLTTNHDTVLHIASFSKQQELVMELLGDILKNDPHSEILRKVNSFGDTILHEAIATGMTQVVDKMLAAVPQLLITCNYNGETPLFRAVHFGQREMLAHLAGTNLFGDILNSELHKRRQDDASILHIAILNESFETALELLSLKLVNPQLIDGCGLTCLQLLANMPLAFKSGTRLGPFKRFIYYCLADCNRDAASCSHNMMSDEESGICELCPKTRYAQLRVAFSKLNNGLWRCLSQGWPAIQEVCKLRRKHESALELVRLLVKTDKSWMVPSHSHGMNPGDISISRDEFPRLSLTDDQHEDFPSEGSLDEDPYQEQHLTEKKEVPLLAAARHGIIEIVEVILEEYPQAIEYVNELGANIMHVAVRNRRTKIFNFLLPFVKQTPRLMMRLDGNGNCLLHQVATVGDFQPKERPGEALHMQWEIQWFKKVRNIVPHHFLNHLNNERLTSEELFTETHKELVIKGQEWLMRTSESCSVVAALIASVAFTSAYTVPGGNQKNSGHPVFLNRRPFLVFTVTDAISLSFSLTSLVVFLSIMTSRFHEQDFHRSLPLRMVFGLTTLFLSVASMMVAFAATLVLMFRDELHWAAIPIYLIACYPVTIFLTLQFPLYVLVSWYTIRDLVTTLRHSFLKEEYTIEDYFRLSCSAD